MSAGWRLDEQGAFGGAGLGWHVETVHVAETLRWTQSLDLRSIPAGQRVEMTFASWLVSAQGSTADVHVSLNGTQWLTATTVAPSTAWTPVMVDLSAYAGQILDIQFVWQCVAPSTEIESADHWSLDEVAITASTPTQTLSATVAFTLAPTETLIPTATATLPPTATIAVTTETPRTATPVPATTAEAN